MMDRWFDKFGYNREVLEAVKLTAGKRQAIAPNTSMPSWKTNIAKLGELSLATKPIIRTVLKVLDLRAASRCKK